MTRIVCVSGLIGSGKDTIADYLCTFHGFKRVSFASSLKDAVAAVFGWDREMLDGITKTSREWREQRDEWWSTRLGMNITPRWVLQYWGTDVLRANFHNDIWVASVEYKLLNAKDDIVITDARFRNEIQAVKSLGGITVRVVRGQDPEWLQYAVDFNKGQQNMGWALAKMNLEKLKIHPSEYSHIGLDYDSVIDNNGTITELHEQVKQVLNLDKEVSR